MEYGRRGRSRASVMPRQSNILFKSWQQFFNCEDYFPRRENRHSALRTKA
ncbi:Uncharacterized protein ToN1_37580 [Aromatoleum petrolei]|nr:Uncharacterized protein ToN1_37580 [Aromatoleum petrolei]